MKAKKKFFFSMELPNDLLERILEESVQLRYFAFGASHAWLDDDSYIGYPDEVVGSFAGWCRDAETFECMVDDAFIAGLKSADEFDGQEPEIWTDVYRQGDRLYYAGHADKMFSGLPGACDLIQIGRLYDTVRAPRIRSVAKQFATLGKPVVFNCEFYLKVIVDWNETRQTVTTIEELRTTEEDWQRSI